MTVELRPYQRDAITALHADWATGLRRLGVSAATGTGKTVIMSHLAAAEPGRTLIIVHRDELVEQTVAKLRAVDPVLSVGVVKAARNQASAQVVIASVQTICRPKRLAQLGRFSLVICDEAHRSMAKQWQTTLDALGCTGDGPGPRTAGFSATWTRADGQALGDFWQKISFTLPISWAIEQGFLVRPVGQYIRTEVRLSKVKKTAGDYNARDMQKRLTKDAIARAIVAAWTEHAADRKGVVFAPTVDTAEFFRAAFEQAGYKAEGLYGITNKEASRAVHDRFAPDGPTQILLSCTRLSEGWDAPWCSAAVIARPTTHAGLFVQMVGRILRPYPGKTDAVIIDPTGVLFKHSIDGVIDMTGSERDPDAEPDEDDEDDELEEDDTGEREESPGVDAELVGYEAVDLLASGRVRWLRTPGGRRFIPAGRSTVFLWDLGAQGWNVGVAPGEDVAAGSWLAWRLDEASAVRVAEAAALETNGYRATADAGWRASPATTRQRAIAREYGLLTRGIQSQGSLFDKIATVRAGRLLDPVRFT